jgi:hypothetical protein
MRNVVVVVVLAVLAFAGGLVVLALLGVRLFRQVKSLGRTVGNAATQVGDASATLETIAPRER